MGNVRFTAIPASAAGLKERIYRTVTKVYDEYVVANSSHLSQKQRMYQEIIFGTLIYAVVVGFFDDYTNILSTSSYSVTFFAAFALALLTYATTSLKKRVVEYIRNKASLSSKISFAAIVWLVLFLSKFAFMELLDLVFRTSLIIDSFFGLTAVVITMTVAKTAFDIGFKKLADK